MGGSMHGTTVRVSNATHQALQKLSQETNTSMQEVLAKAVEAYRRAQFIQDVNASFAVLRADPIAWREVLEERALWDATMEDGLEGDDYEIRSTISR